MASDDTNQTPDPDKDDAFDPWADLDSAEIPEMPIDDLDAVDPGEPSVPFMPGHDTADAEGDA